VGLLRCREPYALQRPIQRLRDKQHFYDEIKWNKVSAKKMPILETLIDVFFGCSDASFSAFVVNKQQHDIIGRFSGTLRGLRGPRTTACPGLDPTRRNHVDHRRRVLDAVNGHLRRKRNLLTHPWVVSPAW